MASRLVTLAFFGGLILSSQVPDMAHAQNQWSLPEEVGIVTDVSPATSTIVISGRRLLVTNDTRVTTDDPRLRVAPLSPELKGRGVGIEVYETPEGRLVLRQLYIPSPSDQ